LALYSLINAFCFSREALMSVDEREDHLTRLVIEQYKHTKNCTIDKRSIKTSLEKQKALINEYNAKEEKRVLEEKKALEK
jgi:hypothetical protein